MPAVSTIVLLLLLASFVATLLSHRRIPYTVGLVVAGLAVDALGLLPPTTLQPQIVLFVLLPPLLFEGAFAIRWDDLRRVAVAATALATLGMIVSAIVTAGVVVIVLHLSWLTAILFGAIGELTIVSAAADFLKIFAGGIALGIVIGMAASVLTAV